MIKPTELRIGNKVTEGEIEIFVTPYLLEKMSSGHQNEDVSGIPLTEDWLFKFGFIQLQGSLGDLSVVKFDEYCLGRFSAMQVGGEEGIWQIAIHSRCLSVFCKFVHQLQNLYFAITGTELEIKETKK